MNKKNKNKKEKAKTSHMACQSQRLPYGVSVFSRGGENLVR